MACPNWPPIPSCSSRRRTWSFHTAHWQHLRLPSNLSHSVPYPGRGTRIHHKNLMSPSYQRTHRKCHQKNFHRHLPLRDTTACPSAIDLSILVSSAECLKGSFYSDHIYRDRGETAAGRNRSHRGEGLRSHILLLFIRLEPIQWRILFKIQLAFAPLGQFQLDQRS